MFIPLHVKSYYSLGMGTASIESLVEWAVRTGTPTLALTDLENLYGQVRFHDRCRRAGVRPICGVELRAGFNGGRETGLHAGRIVLLARNIEGYRNLCRIVSRRRVSSDSSGADPIDSLADHAKGLFVLTDHLPVLRRLLADGRIPRASLRLLLVRPAGPLHQDNEVLQASQESGVPVVADVDAVMLSPRAHALHALLVAIRRGTTVSNVLGQRLVESADRCLREPEELEELFADQPRALLEMEHLAQQCNLDLDGMRAPLAFAERHLQEKLSATCQTALARGRAADRFVGDAYDVRLAHELATLERMGFSGYVAAVADIVAEAGRRGILTAGRGSAAGSLVAYLLGITQIDPIEHGLFFERFLHERRSEPPDIDVDVDSSRRDELIGWVYRRFGRDRVATVSTMQTFQLSSGLRELLRTHGVPPRSIHQLLEQVPHEDDAEATLDRMAGLVPPHLRSRLPLLRQLIGVPHHVSVHPGGLVIVPDSIDSRLPLERAPKGVIVTQYDLRSIEAAGFLKIDVLGNRGLAVIAETIELSPLAGVKHDRNINRAAEIPLDDSATLNALDRADTIGCFQVESPAVRSVLRRLPVRRFDDVVAALAVVRPGAASGGAKHIFLERARERATAERTRDRDAAHSSGAADMPLYEEDILRLSSDASGISISEADALRAAIVSSGEDEAALARLGTNYKRMATAHGRRGAHIRQAWDAATRFAAYSFSRAHAASYALVAFQTVYQKLRAPVEFTCALINHYGGAYPLRTVAASMQRHGVIIRLPDVRLSQVPSGVEEDVDGRSVRLGLATIKNLHRKSMQSIVSARRAAPFRDVGDLLDRVKLRTPEVRALIECGACDGLAPLSPSGFPFVHDALVAGLTGKGDRRALEERIAWSAALPTIGEEADRIALYRALTRIRNELTHLDMHISHHPLAVLRPDAERLGCHTTAELRDHAGEFVRIAGILGASRRVQTSRGETMQFLTLEDEHGTVEVQLFPAVFRRIGSVITTPGPYLVDCHVEEVDGDVHVRGVAIRPFHERHARQNVQPKEDRSK